MQFDLNLGRVPMFDGMFSDIGAQMVQSGACHGIALNSATELSSDINFREKCRLLCIYLFHLI